MATRVVPGLGALVVLALLAGAPGAWADHRPDKTVLVGGAIYTEGSPAEIAADPGVREVYLGKRKHG